MRRYKQSKIARKIGFRGREVNRNIPDPDLDRARTPRQRRYCSPATTGKEAAAGDEGTGGRRRGCRGGAGVEAGGAPPGTARRRRLLRPGRRGAGGGVGRGGGGCSGRRSRKGRRRWRRGGAGRLGPGDGARGPGAGQAGRRRTGDPRRHLAARGWLAARGADGVRSDPDTSVGGGGLICFFFC